MDDSILGDNRSTVALYVYSENCISNVSVLFLKIKVYDLVE